ncbi:hypothetical protein DSLPV1_212 [Dishui lake phycodnavirus 1]|uniref:hypothetical protein n=1 Tax=Dishui lake phycodnavirus 1 TaxID=2079134 RepID=UPI000CD67A6D|nr:hypothetical protein C5Y57_gp186 [Dishui lake phycodnavirus 1]AUT19183.1 hypothetical protein DSLPV1_212 [Dishui lake phycodnavirus 1]
MKNSLKKIMIPVLVVLIVVWVLMSRIREKYDQKDLASILNYIDEQNEIKPMMLYTLVKDAGIKIDMKEFMNTVTKHDGSKDSVKNYVKSLWKK